MRFLTPSIAITCLASCWVVSVAPATPAPQTKPAAITAAPSAADNEAAAKHAKRTLCLKQARAKKLIGEQRTAFIKDCMKAS